MRIAIILITIICVVLTMVLNLFADVINVPDDVETIQDGIDAAENGDTVLVAPGTYEENIDYDGKDIVVASLVLTTGDDAYIDSTIIDGDENGTCVWIEAAYGENTQLVGFSITNGSGKEAGDNTWGGGIATYNSIARLGHLKVFNNHATGGGGVLCQGGAIEFRNVAIFNNEAEGNSGGISSVYCQMLLNYVDLHNNSSAYAGVFRAFESSVTFDHVTFSDNSTDEGTGVIHLTHGSHLTITNSILWNSDETEINCYDEEAQNSIEVSFSDVLEGIDGINDNDNAELEWGDGNIDDNPEFVEPDDGDYRLNADSPCIDTGDPDSPEDPDRTLTDMGAYYHVQDGVVEGYALDVVDEAPLDNAIVTTSYGRSVQTDVDGFWRIDNARIVEFNLTASCRGYNDSTRTNLNFEADDTLRIDFYLLHPSFVPCDDIIVEMRPGISREFDLSIGNRGNGQLTWTAEPRLREELDLEPWQQRTSWDLSEVVDDDGIEGVVFADNNYYISGGGNDDNKIYILNRDGEWIDTLNQPSNSRQGMMDLAFDGELIWGSGESTIYGLTMDGEVETSFEGPYRTNRALTWDPLNEWLWISAINQGIRAYDRDGNTRELLDRKGFLINSLAFWKNDPDEYQLYVFHIRGDGSGQLIHKMNIETGDTLFVADFDSLLDAINVGAFITDKLDFYSWTLMSVANIDTGDQMNIWQLSTNTDWMSINPDSGGIDAGDWQNLTLTLDAGFFDLEDIYEGRIRFNHNADDGVAEVPITMTLPIVGYEEPAIPQTAELFPIHPNPFNAATNISYWLPTTSQVSLQVFDLAGRHVETLAKGQVSAGVHDLTWEASAQPSGLYFIRLETAEHNYTQKITLIR